MGISSATLSTERRLDPDFDAQIKQARKEKFEPVLQHAIELAMQADAYGENEGAIKALDMVLRFASKALDRDVQMEMLGMRLEAAATLANNAPAPVPMLTTPEAVEAYMTRRRQEALGIMDIEEVIPSGPTADGGEQA